jgi:hypothetical protein
MIDNRKLGGNSQFANSIDKQSDVNNRNTCNLSYNCLTSVTSRGTTIIPLKTKTNKTTTNNILTVFRWF